MTLPHTAAQSTGDPSWVILSGDARSRPLQIASPATIDDALAAAATPRVVLVRLPCDRHGVRRGLAAAAAFALDAAIGDDAADKLAIIVEEWLVNVVEHGGGPGRIAMRLERRDGCVRMMFSDTGQPFDPRAVVFEGPNAERGGGAGLALIKAWSRIAGYSRRGGRNRVVLEMAVP